MTDTLRPTTVEDTLKVVKWAAGEQAPLEIVGTGTKRAMGRPVQTSHVLDLADLSGIINYEPAELILTAKPGTPMADIDHALDQAGQMLAFEPIDMGPLLGQPSGGGTVGGLVSCNLCGPRRITKGSARDHVLGVQAVSGRGELFKAGGYVVKNVTGYDLCKGLTGAFGTLAVLTELTLKVVPRPETETTLVLSGLSEDLAMQAMSAAMGSSHEVGAAAHAPADMSGIFDVSQGAATLIRLEGIDVSVAARAKALSEELLSFAKADWVTGDASRGLWRKVRDCAPFCDRTGAVWRLSVAPMSGAPVVAAIKRAIPDAEAYYDWAGGLIWVLVAEETDAGATAIRSAIDNNGGGHATLYRASATTRAAVPVFEPQPAALSALSKRLKAQFDPNGILNPGRMHATY